MAAINERVVHRSNALAGNAYGSRFTYDEAVMTGTGLKGRLTAVTMVAGLGAFMAGVVIKPVRSLMERFLLPKPGEGPSAAAQLAGRYDLRFFGRTDDGKTLRVKVTGDRDPGYGSTGKMLGGRVQSRAGLRRRRRQDRTRRRLLDARDDVRRALHRAPAPRGVAFRGDLSAPSGRHSTESR